MGEKQLTVGDILRLIAKKKAILGLTDEEVNKIPIYVSDDDELNGIHTAYNAIVITTDDEDCEDLIQLIEDNCLNKKVEGLSILIT